MDIILLSQHTHVPMMLTSEEQTPHDKIEYRDQDVYTRSLDVPKWIEKYLLFSFNQHELHHNFPSLPCYYLRPVQDQFKPNYQNTYSLWKWIMQVKSIRAEVFIFKHRKQTGHDI
jgi:fatty acid desaturase